MSTPRPSLIGALFMRVGLVLVVLIVAAGGLTLATAHDKVDEVYDGQLIISATVLRALTADNIDAAKSATELSVDDAALLSADEQEAFKAFANWRMFRIWLNDQLAMRSDTGPEMKSPPKSSGFTDVLDGKREWRIYTLVSQDKSWAVQVGERMSIRSALVNGISLEVALPLLILIPATGFLIWLSLNDGLKAFREFSMELGRRSGRDLAPLNPDAWPRDFRRLVQSVNQLLGRIAQSLQHERRFVDEAAHQLRTPLAVVKLQAELLSRAETPAQRKEAGQRLAAGVDRAAALTDRLLTLARLEGEAGAVGVCDLSALAAASLADIALLAAQSALEMTFSGPAEANVRGDAATLRLVCDNLLENAVRFTPPGGEIAVRVELGDKRHNLIVTDSGPGIPLQNRERVIERFYRAATAPGPGVGLGLAIVSEALRVLDGDLTLDDRDDGRSGLCATVSLPAA